MSIMSKNSKNPKYNGIIFRKPYDIEAFTWKITNVSSIVHEVDYVVQSPPFYFDNASWVLKMYPYGQTVFNSTGFIDVEIERLNRQDGKYGVFVRIYAKDVFAKEINIYTRKFKNGETLREPIRIRNYMLNIKDCPNKWKNAPNDTFTLVCELGKEVNDLTKQDSQEKCAEPNSGDICKLSRNIWRDIGIPEVGEIFKEFFRLQSFLWKLCKISPAVPNGYQSDEFSFAGATWILKVYPYFLMELSDNESSDIVLKRLQSEIPEHYIMLRIEQVQQISIFNAYHTQADVINFPIQEEDGYSELRKLGCLHIEGEIKSRMNIEVTAANDKILQDFKELYLKKEDCDVTIKVKGQEFPAHRVILEARSPVLACAFRIDMKEKATGIVDIEDGDPSSFSDFLCFIYCGEIKNLSEKNVFSLFTAADKYEITDLRHMCMEFIKQNLSVDTFCDTIVLALLHSETELMQLSTYFFAKNLQEIVVTDKWQAFMGNEVYVKALMAYGKQE